MSELRSVFVLGGFVAMLGQGTPQPSKPATPPPTPAGTDIYELTFDGTAERLKSATVRVVVSERGYENQPHFAPEGGAILFTANRDGKQTDIFEFDRASRRVRQLTETSEGEYSPTVTPDRKGFSVIRVETDGTQRLWRFDRNGSNPRLVLTEIKPVGYHVWIDEDRLALFILGQPSTLQLARVATGKAEMVARDIGRSLQRMPSGQNVSFVQREANGEFWVKQFDPAGGAVTPLVRAAEGSSDRDCAWLNDGTLLMSAGTKILAWRSPDQDWREVFDVAIHKLGNVTRIAVAPDGKALAVVVNERDR